MVDTKREAAVKALELIQDQLPARLTGVKGTPNQVTIETDTQKAVQHAWMVVECTPDIAVIKISLLGQLNSWCCPSTILATILSSFKSGDLIGKVSDAGRTRVLNTHCFQPPELPSVEIMSCGHTDPAIIDFLVPKLRELGLDPAVA